MKKHKLQFDKDCKSKSGDPEDRAFSNLLLELDYILTARKCLARLYQDIHRANDIYRNRKLHIQRLDEISGPFSLTVTTDAFRPLKDSFEYLSHHGISFGSLEISALKAVLECLGYISQYDHMLAISKLASLHFTIREYRAKFVTRDKNHSKNFVWKWIGHCYFVLESKIALFFNPFFAIQRELLETSGEECKLAPSAPGKDKKPELALGPTKLDLFPKIARFGDSHAYSVYVLLDKQLLLSQPTLMFSGAAESGWKFAKSSNILLVYEWHREKVEYVRESGTTESRTGRYWRGWWTCWGRRRSGRSRTNRRRARICR